jgi:hypothetical protein
MRLDGAGAIRIGKSSEGLALKHCDCCSEASLGGIVDDHREGHAVELLLDLAPLLTAGLELAHFLKEVSEVWTALELQRELQQTIQEMVSQALEGQELVRAPRTRRLGR